MPQCRTKSSRRPSGGPETVALVVAFLAISVLTGCSTAQIDSIPKDIGGLPDAAPKRAENPPAYPAVHDMPPTRAAALLDQDQQKRMEADLVAARNRQPGQEKNRLRDAQKKAKEEAKAKQAQEKGLVGKDPNKRKYKLARQPAGAANAPAANAPAASVPVASPSAVSPWPVPTR